MQSASAAQCGVTRWLAEAADPVLNESLEHLRLPKMWTIATICKTTLLLSNTPTLKLDNRNGEA